MYEWEYLFKPKILERGQRYARQGAVKHFVRKEDRIEAIVAGSENYKVILDSDWKITEDAYCSCPYAAEGNLCKHMAAVLYEAEKRNLSGDPSEFDGVTGKEDDEYKTSAESVPVQIEELISGADREELVSILIELASEDDNLESHIRARLARNRILINNAELKWEVDNIFDTYAYRGSIDYHNAIDFASDLIRYLENISEYLLERQKYMDAFELTIYAFVKAGNFDIDDDGEISMISSSCYRIWQKINSVCSENDRRSIKDWFQRHSTDGTVIDYMEYTLQDFLKYELASEEELWNEIAQLDQIIENCKENSRCDNVYTAFYGYNIEAIDFRIILMKRLGADEMEVDQFRRKYLNFRSVRDYYLKKAREENDVNAQITLLKSGQKLDSDSSYLVHAYAQQLIELYHSAGDYELEKAERRNDLLSYPLFAMEEYRMYRNMCSSEEWEKDRALLIEAQYDGERKCELLSEELMYDQLIELIEQQDLTESIKYLNRFGFLLPDQFSERILDLYQKYVSELADYARNRSNYDTLLRYLFRMQHYPGGEEIVKNLCRKWIEMYPTRKVMVQKLRELI